MNKEFENLENENKENENTKIQARNTAEEVNPEPETAAAEEIQTPDTVGAERESAEASEPEEVIEPEEVSEPETIGQVFDFLMAHEPIEEERISEEPAREPVFYQAPVYTRPTVAPKAASKGGGPWKVVSALLMVVCIVVSSFAIGIALDSKTQPTYVIQQSSTPSYDASASQLSTTGALTYTQICEKIAPSVVDIKTTSTSGAGLASGIIYTTDGYIVTNAHVVEGTTSVSVVLYPSGEEYKATVIGYDSASDLAVIKIEAEGLIPAEFGDSSQLVQGEQVVAMGTPYDISLSHTASEGIVSAIRDSHTFSDLRVTLDLIQHTASINPGNSGGPLVNRYGQVIGINAVKLMGDYTATYENIGFAIQINSAIPIIQNIMNTGSANRPALGISCQDETTIGGILVMEVNPGSAAEEAGLRVGDLITKFDDVRVKSTSELKAILNKYQVGQTVTVSVLRDAEIIVLDITLKETTTN